MAKKIDTNYVNENVQKVADLKRKVILLGVAAAISFFLVPPIGVVIAIVLAFLANKNYHELGILKSGLKGETFVERALLSLPDEYYVAVNIPIALENKRSEIDALIVSPYGVDIVEVKNHNGDIVGKANESSWIQHKMGRGGTPYQKEMRNPIKQLGTQKYILSEILKANKVKVWVDGLVWFTGANSVSVDSDIVFANGQDVCRKIIGKRERVLDEKTIQAIIGVIQKESMK